MKKILLCGVVLAAAVGVVTLPFDIVVDVVTMGGAINDKKRPYTAEKCRSIMRNIEDATR